MSHTEEVPITKVAISHVVGKGGETIKGLKAKYNVSIEIVDESIVKISGDDKVDCMKCRDEVQTIINEQANPDYEGLEGKRLRQEADSIGNRRDELKKEAQLKFDAGDKDAGHKLMAEVTALTAAMHARNKEAAAAIVKNRNDGKGEAYLDLHGLRTEEALEVTKARIAELEEKPTGTSTALELIPGAGHHSAPGKIALKPACANLLKDLGLAYTDQSAGSFLVTVPGKGASAAATPTPAPAEPAAAATAESKDEAAAAPVVTEPKTDGEEKAKQGCCTVM